MDGGFFALVGGMSTIDYMLELDSLLRPPSRSLVRFPNDRRLGDRVAMRLGLSEYVGDRMQRGLAQNLSATGLYLDRVFGAGLDRLQLGRDERRVQLEFELPKTSESIWALAEVCHDQIGQVGIERGRTAVHGTGVRFLAMARKHERLIEDYVFEERRRGLAWLLDRVTNRRRRDRRRLARRLAEV